MGTTISGVRTADLPDLGAVTDASSVVAEYAGTGRFSAPALRSYINGSRPTSVKDSPFYAKGDGATDDTAAIQAAVTAAANGPLYIPPGTYKITAAINITAGMAIHGAGKTLSVLQLATNAMTGLNITGAAPVTIQSLQISPAGGVTGTTGIKLSVAENSESIFRDLQLVGLDKGIDTETSGGWTVDNCDFLLFTNIGLLVRESLHPDSGDSCVSNCYFLAANTSVPACLQQSSSGGLKITNSKFLSGFYGFGMVLDTGAVTGDLMISNSSFEGQTLGAAIELQQVVGAGSSFHSAVITGCQINSSLVGIGVSAVNGAGWLTDLVVSGCEIFCITGGRGFSIDGVDGFNISGCNCYSLGTGITAAVIGTHSSRGLLMPINCVGTGFSTYCTNSGSACIIQPKIQAGHDAANTTTAFGALFQGPGTNVTFSPHFLNVPTVICNPTTYGGLQSAVSVIATSVTVTGFTPVVVGTVNATPIGYDWSALGN